MNHLVRLNTLVNINIESVKQFENSDRDRPDFQNKYLKMLFFFINEGIRSTLRKYFAHRYPQKRYLTLIHVLHQGQKYVNVSLQFHKTSDDFVIRNTFVPFVDVDYHFIENNLNQLLSHFNQFEQIPDYRILNLDITNAVSFTCRPPVFMDKYERGLFVFGLGGYIRMFVMHHFKGMRKIACIDYKSQVVNDFKNKYGFRHGFVLPSNAYSLVENTEEPVAIIATYHADHASLAHEIYQRNPKTHIFIEKPPSVTLEDLDKLIDLYNNGASIEMGFNRRFIDYSRYVKKQVDGKTLMVTCSVKEVVISENHWYFWKNQGTRITGNLVHWFDLGGYWIQSMPVEINLMANPENHESVAVSILYKNGSILNITASDKGNSLRGVQEKIEVRYDEETIFIDDFTSMTHIKNNGFKIRKRKLVRNKGHNVMYRQFNHNLNANRSSDYTVYDLIRTTVVTYYASEMIRTNQSNLKIESEINRFVEKYNRVI